MREEGDCIDAETFFNQARDAARDLDRMTKALERMKSGEGIGGASLGPMAPHGSISDPMSKVDARLDRESIWSRQIEECQQTVDTATAILYGTDGRTGLARALGNLYADTLWLRYLDSRTIKAIAILYQCSRSRVYHLTQIALDFIDSNGFDDTMRGRNTVC